ncbi:MAG: methylated-DNA--[protein]-cysteine S-methyltransferase [Hyphomicrobiaceae bacterium]
MADSDHSSGFALFPTAIGTCALAWRGDVVIATTLPEAHEAATRQRIAARSHGASERAPTTVIEPAVDAITALLAGEQVDLSFIACDLGADDDFNARVYRIARTIPPGATLTYGDVALRLGDKQLAQAVGRALGRNPLPIIVPCHRVLGASGKLTGFSATGGVATKLRLLAIEGAAVGAATSLFADLPLVVKPQPVARRSPSN